MALGGSVSAGATFKGVLVGGHLGCNYSLVYLEKFLEEWANIMSPRELFLNVPLSTESSLCFGVFVCLAFNESQ